VLAQSFEPNVRNIFCLNQRREPTSAQPAAFGAGRIVKFSKPVPFSEVVDRIKRHLNLPYVQVGYGGSKFTMFYC